LILKRSRSKDGLANWWDRDHISILDRSFNMGLFAGGLALYANFDLIPLVAVATLIGGKEIGEAIRAAVALLKGIKPAVNALSLLLALKVTLAIFFRPIKWVRHNAKPLICVVQLGGLEPPTSCSTDRRSNQLSYNCILRQSPKRGGRMGRKLGATPVFGKAGAAPD
jgi:hypothetical protein